MRVKNLMMQRRTLRRQKKRPILRFTPYAWAKLLYLRDLGPTEIGGFGIAAADDLLLVEDFLLVQQLCTPFTVRFDDTAVADFFDLQVERGLEPRRFARIWLHTHPGSSAEPSTTDEETFARCFGSADWAVMFILARGGQAYARLRFNAGPGGEMLLPMDIAFDRPFPAADQQCWNEEYAQCVVAETFYRTLSVESVLADSPNATERDSWARDWESLDLQEVL